MEIDTSVQEKINYYKEKYNSGEGFEHLNKKYKVKSFCYLPDFEVHTFTLEEGIEETQWQNDGEAGLYYENIQLKKENERLKATADINNVANLNREIDRLNFIIKYLEQKCKQN